MNGKSGLQHMEFEACVAESARTCLLFGPRLCKQGLSLLISETDSDSWIGKWVQSSCAETNHKTRSSYASCSKDTVGTSSHVAETGKRTAETSSLRNQELRTGTSSTAVLSKTWEDGRMNAETMQCSTHGVRFACNAVVS